jgi:hypothetical protein
LVSGREVILHDAGGGPASQILLECDVPSESGLVIDQVMVEGIRQDLDDPAPELGPRFVHGIRAPMDLKIPYVDSQFPFGSTLAGLHVSVACCTGCNGGVHDRGLVVLNNHTGGSWSGIWVQTAQPMPKDYRRWQKVEFLGGVLRDDFGSITVVDEGWMQVRLGDESTHSAPPPARVTASDLPAEGTPSLLAFSLDASWVEFADVSVVDVTRVEATAGDGKARLPRVEARFSDASGTEAISWRTSLRPSTCRLVTTWRPSAALCMQRRRADTSLSATKRKTCSVDEDRRRQTVCLLTAGHHPVPWTNLVPT